MCLRARVWNQANMNESQFLYPKSSLSRTGDRYITEHKHAYKIFSDILYNSRIVVRWLLGWFLKNM